MKCLEKDRARRYETVNGLASDTQGVDAVAHYRVPTADQGTFDFTLAGNYNRVHITKVPTSTGTVVVPAR